MEPTVIVPEVPEEPQLFGPSSIKMMRGPEGITYEATVFVGGKGLSKDGRWGETIVMSFTRPPLDQNSLQMISMQLVSKYEPVLREKFGPKGTAVLSLLLVSAVQGKTTSRQFTVEDFENARRS